MDIVWRNKWTDALRSGKYQQGKFKLRTKDDKYCCLGVFCDIFGVEWVETESGGHIYRCYDALIGGEGNSNYLPQAIREQAGLDYYTEQTLSNMNDEGKDFPAIVEWIEANL